MNDVFEVLIHFFTQMENGFFSTQQQDQFLSDLTQLGIALDKLQGALDAPQTMASINPLDNDHLQSSTGIRVYTEAECFRLHKKCRGFLLSLEQQGILTPFLREIVIAQLLKLPHEIITPQQIKWVTLSVLFSQTKQVSTINMERLLLHETPEQKH